MTKLLQIASTLLLLLMLWACGTTPEDLPYSLNQIAPSEINHHLIVVANYESGIRARAFRGAVPPRTRVTLEVLGYAFTQTADDHGRFDIQLRDVPQNKTLKANFTFSTLDSENQITYRVRDVESALDAIPGVPIATGQNPVRVQTVSKSDGFFAMVATSGDAELQTFSLSDEGTLAGAPSSLRFPVDERNGGANPSDLVYAVFPELALVSLWGQHRVAVVSPWSGEIISYAEARDARGKRPIFPLEHLAILRRPVDALNNGSPTRIVGATVPRNPQALYVHENFLLVSYGNWLQFAEGSGKKAKLGPGLVALYQIENGDLRYVDTTRINCQNPGAIRVDEQLRPWIFCAGIYEYGDDKNLHLATSGALIQLKALHTDQKLEEERVIELKDFSPATPAFINGRFYVGSNMSNEILIIDQDAKSASRALVHAVPDAAQDSGLLSEAVSAYDAWVWITDFNADRIIVVDTETNEINPWPFSHGIPLKRNPSKISNGPIALALREGKPGVDYQGSNAFVALNLSSQMLPINLMHLMGP